jgi:hypothetical protein
MSRGRPLPGWAYAVAGLGRAGHASWRGRSGLVCSVAGKGWTRHEPCLGRDGRGIRCGQSEQAMPCGRSGPGWACAVDGTSRERRAPWLGRARACVKTCKRCGWIGPALWPGRPGHAHWPSWSCSVACTGSGMRHGRAGGADMSRGQAGQGMGRGRAWSAASAPWLAQVLP